MMKQDELLLNNLKIAIWATFPSIETFHHFKSEQRNVSIIENFIIFAHRKELIPKESEADFEGLVKKCCELYGTRKPSYDLTFETLLEAIKEDISIKGLVHELKYMARLFGFEEPNEVIFSRLKRDFQPTSLKKRHTLIVLAIWLNLTKPELGLNYPMLLGFPRHPSDVVIEEKKGILMEFTFTERRGNIDPSMMDFMKEALPQCIQDLNIYYLSGKRIHYMATNCTARLPVKEGFSGLPSSYGEAIRDALSLAYQMVIAWQLSPLYNTRIHFSIAIDAGAFEKMENSIKDLQSPTLPVDSPIRLSHFAYTIAKEGGMRVIFKEIEYPNIWSAEHFWAFPYFKSPPVLMPGRSSDKRDTSLLPVRDETIQHFRNALYSGDVQQFPLLAVIGQYPPKIMLSLEVAHIATLRRLNHEAIHLLSHVLSIDPFNCVALTLRLQNFIALGNYAGEWETAALLFDRGTGDGAFVEKYCQADPVFFATYSLLFWSRATKLIRLLRRGRVTDPGESRQAEVLQSLQKAEYYAKMGMSVSPSGADNRCSFWLGHYYAFRHLIEKDPDLLIDGQKPFEDSFNIYTNSVRHVFRSLGWLMPSGTKKPMDDFLYKRLTLSMGNYLNSVSAVSHYANVVFSAGTVLWDFSEPEEKNQIIDQVLILLEVALEKADLLKKQSLGVYICTEIQSPGEFIRSIRKVKSAVEGIRDSGNYESNLKLSLLNFDDETKQDPITFDLIQAEEQDE